MRKEEGDWSSDCFKRATRLEKSKSSFAKVAFDCSSFMA